MFAACAAHSLAQPTAGLLDLDLEDLVEMEFRSVVGLTVMDARHRPVAMTELGERELMGSGSRDINTLLEAYVPNLQFIDHHHLSPHLGFRGIISDREDKYLYQVNGRIMNNRLLLGAANERALPLLGDLRRVTVVRGPASATHGSGALAGVINAETHNGLTFHGTDLGLRHGVGDEFSVFEVRHGQQFEADSGLFMYYGLAKENGADSPYYIGRSYPAKNGLPPNVAGKPVDLPIAALHEPAFDELRHKAHVSYVNGPLELWARFVQDGGENRAMREIYTMNRPDDVTLEEWVRGRRILNQQLTFTARLDQEISPEWRLDAMLSADTWRLRDERAGVYDLPVRRAREDEVMGRAVAVWTPSERHSLAMGADVAREWFRNPPYSDTLDRAPAVTDRNWSIWRGALLAEYQWKPAERWTAFMSLRHGTHTFSRWLPAPRATLVYAAGERDTFKLMAGESIRRGGDEEVWAEWQRRGTVPEPERLRSFELSHEHRFANGWSINTSGFYQDYDAIGWIPSLYYSSSIGRYGIGGIEAEAAYRTERTIVSLSHGYTKLASATLPASLPAVGAQGVTAEPYGFGDDLAEWSPGITKLTWIHDLTERWSTSGSLVYYSGFPGAQDYADYAATLPAPASAMPVSDPAFDDPYGPNLFVSLGVEFRPTALWVMRIDGANLAELADETLSKRNYYFRLSEYSVQPASLILSVRREF